MYVYAYICLCLYMYMYMYVSITESLCCIPETNKALLINHTEI